MPGRWVVVVPVKDAAAGKTRLSGALDDHSRTALARAMALDTIAAAAACDAVRLAVVVTSDRVVAGVRSAAVRRVERLAGETARGSDEGGFGTRPGFDPSRPRPAGPHAEVRVVAEPSHTDSRSGLDAAAAAGVAAARGWAPSAPVGVLLGDLPALRPADLAAALEAAEARARAFVADAQGTGTTLLTVNRGVPFDSRFGIGSASAHVELGYALLDIAESSTLRRDIDLPADLDVLLESSPGPRTARLLAGGSLAGRSLVERRTRSSSAGDIAPALGEQPPHSATGPA